MDNNTALMNAITNHDIHDVEALLNMPDIDINAPHHRSPHSFKNILDGHFNFSFLSAAVCIGNTDIVKCLLAHPAIDVNLDDEDGTPALIHAVRNRRTDCVQLLLARPELDVKTIHARRSTVLKRALTLAAFEKDTDTFQVLLNHRDTDFGELLRAAIIDGNAVIVRCLLNQPGINVNQKSTNGETALTLTVTGLSILYSMFRQNHLHKQVAISEEISEHIMIIQALLAQPGIDVYARDDWNSKTALMDALSYKNPNSELITALERAQMRQDFIEKLQRDFQLTYSQAWAATVPEVLELAPNVPLIEDLTALVMAYLTPISHAEATGLQSTLKKAPDAYLSSKLYLAEAEKNTPSLAPCDGLAASMTATTPSMPQRPQTDIEAPANKGFVIS